MTTKVFVIEHPKRGFYIREVMHPSFTITRGPAEAHRFPSAEAAHAFLKVHEGERHYRRCHVVEKANW